MKTLKLVILAAALTCIVLLAIGVSVTNAPWSHYTLFRFGWPDSLDNASIGFRDGKIYLQDFYGNRNYDVVLRDATGRIVTLDSALYALHGLFGRNLSLPDTSLAAFFNGNVLFYYTVYTRDGQRIGTWSGNGAGVIFENAVGTKFMNNKGVAARIAQNAAEGALMVDSAQITMIAPILTLTNGSTTLQAMANSGAYGWIGTQTNDVLYLGVNNSGKILINTNGTLRFLAYGAGTLRSDASGNVTATASDTVGLGAALWANRNQTYYNRANSDTWNSNQHQSWASTPTTQALQDGRLRAWPFWVGKGYSIDSLRFEVSTGASGNVAFAIYIDSNGDLYPDTRVFDLGAYTTTVAAAYGDTSTVSLVASGSSFTFQDNTMYWLGVHAKGGATLRSIPLGSVPHLLGYNPAMGANSEYTAWSLSSTYTYPNPCPDPFSGSASKLAAVPPPLLIWRVKP